MNKIRLMNIFKQLTPHAPRTARVRVLAVHVGRCWLFQDFLNDVMHCKIEDDLSFRDVICFEV